MASERDIERIHELLSQVAMVHHKGRPDLFKYGQRKYTDEQLKEILKDKHSTEWLGYNRLFESNLRKSSLS